jgi:WD40 repeat protein
MSGESKPRQFTYDAFASYATDPDRDLVRDVEDFVESLHRDRLLSREFREELKVCVDGQDFRIPRPDSSDPKTFEQILRKVVRECQESSRCLLVFSGSDTSSHPWINAEIEWWREQPGFGPIFFVLTHGQLGNYLGENGSTAYRKAAENLLPDALTRDRRGLNELWFDLRGYHSRSGWRRWRRSLLARTLRAESRKWNIVRDYNEERFKLATQILALRLEKDLSKEDVLPKWKSAWRLKQRLRRLRFWTAGILFFGGVVLADRTMEAQRIEELTGTAQAAVNEQEYERAMKAALRGVPLDGSFFWRRGWSDVGIKKLLAVLAGASQMSPYAKQLKNDDYENGARMPFRTAEFDPDAKRIVTASNGGSVVIWDLLTGKKLTTCIQDQVFAGYAAPPGSTSWVRDTRFGQTAETILSAGRYGAWIWTPDCKTCSAHGTASCELKSPMVGHSADVRTAMFNSNWTKVVTTSDDETVKEWDVTTGRELDKFKLPESDFAKGYRYTTGAEYSPDGKSIVVSRRDGLIAIMDVQTRKAQQILQSSGAAVWSAHFNRTGQQVIASSGNGNVTIWDVRTGRPAAFFWQASGVGKSTFSPDERYILTTSLDNVARIWDVATLQQIFTLKGHARSLTSAAFSPDGQKVVTTSDDGTARIWNIGTSILPLMMNASSKSIQCGTVSNDGRKFAAGTSDGSVIIYDVSTKGELTPGPSFRGGPGAVTSVSFGRNSATLIVATAAGRITRWHTDSQSAELVAELPPGDAYAASSPDGNLVAIASSLDAAQYSDKVMNISERTSTALAEAAQITGIEFDRGGSRIAGATDIGLKGQQFAFVWDARSGRKLQKLGNPGKVLSAHFNRNSTLLATSTIDRKAVIWDLASGKQLQVLTGHTYDVNSARFSLDGKRLVTASSDRTVRIWDVETGVSMLKFTVGREANDAFFVNDDNQIIVITASGHILTYDVSWIRERDRKLVVRTCIEKLPNIDEDGLCSRIGPFSSTFWRQLLVGSGNIQR